MLLKLSVTIACLMQITYPHLAKNKKKALKPTLVVVCSVIFWTHLLSTTRAARASAEKPPKTTLCTAPMRAQASMATGSSTTMGM